MAKFPYLFRRNNFFYFRVRIPSEHQKSFKAKEFVRSLRTQNQAEATLLALELTTNFKSILHKQQTGETVITSYAELAALLNDKPRENLRPSRSSVNCIPHSPHTQPSPLLSYVINDFLNRYDKNNKATLTKLNATLPILQELVGDKPINQILQADINVYFDDVQKLPVRRDAKIFNGMSIKEIIESNTDKCISKGTFTNTYRACASIFLNWAAVHYKDQGFPTLSTQGSFYRGERADGINKQRAMKPDELRILFGHAKMKEYATNPDTAHYCWLPLIGLHTGARINEICQLNPGSDILQDETTGIWYFNFDDEGDSADGVAKSIKNNSSKRVVPIHSQLLDLGFLHYVERIRVEGHKLIFPAWKPRNGKASPNAAKWFKRYLESTGLNDETPGARLTGFHSFRHTFVTHGINNKIQGVFAITGHEVESVDGFGKVSKVAAGYWTKGKADNLAELKDIIERFHFGIDFFKPL